MGRIIWIINKYGIKMPDTRGHKTNGFKFSELLLGPNLRVSKSKKDQNVFI